jgi:EmrB/QacA subfamily drug resistance transporter
MAASLPRARGEAHAATGEHVQAAEPIRYASATGRWVIAATVLGSGIAFLDSTVVNVALPAISDDLDTGIRGLQWVLDGYLVTLTALILLGGSLGDHYGRKRMFVYGLIGFTIASVLCGVAPNTGMLIFARALQGVGGALLVPGSLAIISATFHPDDRSRAIGAWSGLAGVSSALGPLVGGYLVDAVSWRWVFLINVPLAAIAIWITIRHVPESRDETVTGRPDALGAVLASAGLAALAYACIEGPHEITAGVIVTAVLGAAALIAFIFVEMRIANPMLPMDLFRSQQFTGANLTTLAVYTALGGALFLVVLELQLVLNYSALEAGIALFPITALMLLLSPRAGALAQRIGPRIPMTVGPFIVAVGLLLFARVDDGESYVATVLPAATVFGFGLALTVAPLTAAVLGAVEDRHVGIASGVNNAVARLAGLLAVAVLPGLVGLDTATGGSGFSDGYMQAMMISAVIAVAGGLIAFATVRKLAPNIETGSRAMIEPCLPAGCAEQEAA